MSIVLVSMPYAAVERPSLALGLLAAQLSNAGYSVECVYANMMFAELTGMSAYKMIESDACGYMLGDWTFSLPAHGAAPRRRYVYDAALMVSCRAERPASLVTCLPKTVFALEELATEFIDILASRVLARKPRIVGCSSVFEQHMSSLAFLRRVKQLAPDVITIMGGPNCESALGRSTIRHFPFVDIVVSGDADELIVDLAEQLLMAGVGYSPEILPYGCMSQKRRGVLVAPRAIVDNLDALPLPNFDDYFATLHDLSIGDLVEPGLVVETSRGCWYGEKHHCTFCGQNGSAMNYRSKTPGRAATEFRVLRERYGTGNFGVVDNILDRRYFDELLPVLEQEGGYRIFYEVKSNLSRNDVQRLHSAGVRSILPGIESLDDDLLRLMRKGSTSIRNIQALKWGREVGVYMHWILLVDVPGAAEISYMRMAELFPLLHHLQPPNSIAPIEFHRFSPYVNDPRSFGLELCPFPGYRAVYPQEIADDPDTPYYFVDSHRAPSSAAHGRLHEAVAEWRAAFWDDGARLEIRHGASGVVVLDTRRKEPIESPVDALTLQVLGACRASVLEKNLMRELVRTGTDCEGAVALSLQACLDLGWIVRSSGRLLSLIQESAGEVMWDDYKVPNGIAWRSKDDAYSAY